MILNISNKPTTEEEISAGVVEIESSSQAQILGEAHHFESEVTHELLMKSARQLADIMHQYDPHITNEITFLVGGNPALMTYLTLYAPIYKMVFSEHKKTVKTVFMPDGIRYSTSTTYKHMGFTPMYCPDF